MSNIENFYKENAVSISYESSSGSGCLFQSNSKDFTFIFTAKHCLAESGDIDVNKIVVKRYLAQEEDLPLKVLEVHVSSDLDIAILVISKISVLEPLQIIEPAKNSTVTIYGYPNKLSGKVEPRENLEGNVTFRHKDYFEIAAKSVQFTYDTEVPSNILGLSGSGVFCEVENELKLVGVFARLKAANGIYNKFCCFNLHVFNDLFIKITGESLVGDDFSKMIRDPEIHNKVFYLAYTVESEQYYLKRKIDEQIQNYLKSNKNVWISGDSGVGKTNLIFRTLFFNQIGINFYDLSAQSTANVTELFNYINEEIITQHNIQTPSPKFNVLEKITQNLNEIDSDCKEIVLFVDEIPISNKEVFSEFLNGFITISEAFNALPNRRKKVKWIISTRLNPSNFISKSDDCLPNNNKALKNFYFKNFESWERDELKSLLLILESGLNFQLSDETQNKIIDNSKNLPRLIKDTIERLIVENCSIEDAINMIKSENA